MKSAGWSMQKSRGHHAHHAVLKINKVNLHKIHSAVKTPRDSLQF